MISESLSTELSKVYIYLDLVFTVMFENILFFLTFDIGDLFSNLNIYL